MGAKSDSARVVAIAGSDPLQLAEKVADVLRDAGVDPSDGFDHVELDGVDTDASTVLQAATTVPFLGTKRSVVVRRADRLRDREVETLGEALSTLPASAFLVLVFEPTEDGAKGASLKSAAKKAGTLIEIRAPKRDDVLRELKTRAQSAGLSFQPRAVEALAEMVSDDLSEAVSELGKLIAACSSRGSISVADVNEIVIPSREYRVFTLLDHVCDGRLGPALMELDRLLSATSKVEEAAMRHLLPQMQKQLLSIYQARALSEERVPLSSPGASRYLHGRYSFATLSDFPRRKAVGFARRLDLRQISRMLRLVLETDMRLKGQLPQANPRETLERMLAEMCLTAQQAA